MRTRGKGVKKSKIIVDIVSGSSLMFSCRCRKSGWPLCGPACEAKVAHNPEVVIPHQTEGTFEIDDYGKPCYLYECVAPLRALFLQKSAPLKFKKVRSNSRLSSKKTVGTSRSLSNPLVADHVARIPFGEEKGDAGVGQLSRDDCRGREKDAR